MMAKEVPQEGPMLLGQFLPDLDGQPSTSLDGSSQHGHVGSPLQRFLFGSRRINQEKVRKNEELQKAPDAPAG